LIEGTTVATKHGAVRTDHILFIASGSFHLAKPSDLLPELQGRLPIRVELKALDRADFRRILTEPEASLVTQYKALLATEGIDLDFLPEAILLRPSRASATFLCRLTSNAPMNRATASDIRRFTRSREAPWLHPQRAFISQPKSWSDCAGAGWRSRK